LRCGKNEANGLLQGLVSVCRPRQPLTEAQAVTVRQRDLGQLMPRHPSQDRESRGDCEQKAQHRVGHHVEDIEDQSGGGGYPARDGQAPKSFGGHRSTFPVKDSSGSVTEEFPNVGTCDRQRKDHSPFSRID
jgi:hypothetical protein